MQFRLTDPKDSAKCMSIVINAIIKTKYCMQLLRRCIYAIEFFVQLVSQFGRDTSRVNLYLQCVTLLAITSIARQVVSSLLLATIAVTFLSISGTFHDS